MNLAHQSGSESTSPPLRKPTKKRPPVKNIAVTSFNSGPLILNEDEVSKGWRIRNEIAYSPKVQAAENLAYGECVGFDEWYVFDAPADLGRIVKGNIFEAALKSGLIAVFVNYSGFAFHTPESQDLAKLFWTQLEQIGPETFIADGDLLNFATRDKVLFKVVLESLESAVPKSR